MPGKFDTNIVAIIFAVVVILGASCKKDSSETESTSGGTAEIDATAYSSGTAEGSTEAAVDEDDLVENSTFTNTVSINFGTNTTIVNPLAGEGVVIEEVNNDVVIQSTVSGVNYILSGTTSNGSVKIYSSNKFSLTLNEVSISNTDGPAINIQSSKRAFIVLADNTANTLSDGSTYATAVNDEDQKATFFSEGQLIFSGSGALNITANYKHAICSDDYVRVRSGKINVVSAASDGIHTNDAFIADGGEINIKASADGIQCEEGYIVINDGNFTINSVEDAIVASYEESDTSITPFVTINGGVIDITTTEGEGIESKSILTINNGTITTRTADDGLNASNAIYINGGSVYSISSGNDAMDSNGTFTVTGGKVIAIGARQPEAGIDCDARTFKVTGGLIIGTGGATSAPTANVSTVYSVVMGGASANQVVHVEDADGKEVLTFLSPTTFSTMLISSSKFAANTNYTVYLGGSVTNATEWNGLYTAGSYARGNSAASFTTSSILTQIGGNISRN